MCGLNKHEAGSENLLKIRLTTPLLDTDEHLFYQQERDYGFLYLPYLFEGYLVNYFI